MREIFRQELEHLGDDVQRMAAHVATAIDKATRALREADLLTAEEVIDADQRIDELEKQLDDLGVSVLARQQPVATDLRIVVSGLRLSATIERMGDLARHVAYVARGRYPEHALDGPMAELIDEMGVQAAKVATKVVELIGSRDLSLAAEIEREDDVLDGLHRRSFEIVLDDNVPMTRQQVVDAVLLGRYLERFGDHSVSVARRVAYLVTGEAMYSTDHRDGEDGPHRD